MSRRHFSIWVCLMVLYTAYLLCEGIGVGAMLLVPLAVPLGSAELRRHFSWFLGGLGSLVALCMVMLWARLSYQESRPPFPAFSSAPLPPPSLPQFIYVGSAGLILFMLGLSLWTGYRFWRQQRNGCAVGRTSASAPLPS